MIDNSMSWLDIIQSAAIVALALLVGWEARR